MPENIFPGGQLLIQSHAIAKPCQIHTTSRALLISWGQVKRAHNHLAGAAALDPTGQWNPHLIKLASSNEALLILRISWYPVRPADLLSTRQRRFTLTPELVKNIILTGFFVCDFSNFTEPATNSTRNPVCRRRTKRASSQR